MFTIILGIKIWKKKISNFGKNSVFADGLAPLGAKQFVSIIMTKLKYIGRDRVNTLGPRQNGCQSPDDTFKCIFLNENVRILIEISLKFVPKGPIDNKPALAQIMAWRWPGDKPLSEPMLASVSGPQWVKMFFTSPDLAVSIAVDIYSVESCKKYWMDAILLCCIDVITSCGYSGITWDMLFWWPCWEPLDWWPIFFFMTSQCNPSEDWESGDKIFWGLFYKHIR